MNIYDDKYTPPVTPFHESDEFHDIQKYSNRLDDAEYTWHLTKSVNMVGRQLYLDGTCEFDIVRILVAVISIDDLTKSLVECITKKHRDQIARFDEYVERLMTAYYTLMTKDDSPCRVDDCIAWSIVNWMDAEWRRHDRLVCEFTRLCVALHPLIDGQSRRWPSKLIPNPSTPEQIRFNQLWHYLKNPNHRPSDYVSPQIATALLK